MNIFLTNDDGIDAFGLKSLAEALAGKHNLTVFAPDVQRSAASHSITIGKPLSYKKAEGWHKSIEAYAVSGTPADCVKFGLLHHKAKPDLVISGINHGPNLGSDIMYSGTVSAAREAAYMGCRAFAFSCDNLTAGTEGFRECAEFAAQNLDRLLSLKVPANTILNVNHPAGVSKGIVCTKMGLQHYDDFYKMHEDGADGVKKYTLTGAPIPCRADEDTDVEWCRSGYVSVTPLRIDMTDYVFLSELERLTAEKPKK